LPIYFFARKVVYRFNNVDKNRTLIIFVWNYHKNLIVILTECTLYFILGFNNTIFEVSNPINNISVNFQVSKTWNFQVIKFRFPCTCQNSNYLTLKTLYFSKSWKNVFQVSKFWFLCCFQGLGNSKSVYHRIYFNAWKNHLKTWKIFKHRISVIFKNLYKLIEHNNMLLNKKCNLWYKLKMYFMMIWIHVKSGTWLKYY